MGPRYTKKKPFTENAASCCADSRDISGIASKLLSSGRGCDIRIRITARTVRSIWLLRIIPDYRSSRQIRRKPGREEGAKSKRESWREKERERERERERKRARIEFEW